jgi:hypothetical protein
MHGHVADAERLRYPAAGHPLLKAEPDYLAEKLAVYQPSLPFPEIRQSGRRSAKVQTRLLAAVPGFLSSCPLCYTSFWLFYLYRNQLRREKI